MANTSLERANLASIARQVGVSQSTVHRALNDSPGINAETRDRIKEIAKKMGYVARAKKLGDSISVIALSRPTSMAGDHGYLAGMSREAINVNIAFQSHHVRFAQSESILQQQYQPVSMQTGMVKGLILVHRWPEEIAKKLAERWPTISIVHNYSSPDIDVVGTNDQQGMTALLKHLTETNCRRIGFFGLSPEMSWSTSRYSAYLETLLRMGHSYDPSSSVQISLDEASSPSPFPVASWSRIIDLKIKQGVDAWVCPSAVTAYTLLQYLISKGVRVPQDVCVTGFHAMQAPIGLPELTSTEVDNELLGATAIRHLQKRLANPTVGHRSILVPTRFHKGDTTRDLKS